MSCVSHTWYSEARSTNLRNSGHLCVDSHTTSVTRLRMSRNMTFHSKSTLLGHHFLIMMMIR